MLASRRAILKTKRLEILPDDDLASLAERLLPLEHEVQIEALEDFMNDRIREMVREKPLIARRKKAYS